MINELIGLVGSLFFAFCSWPLACWCLKRHSAKGVDWSMIILHLTGATFSTIYAIGAAHYVLLFNYLSGGAGMFIVLLIKIRERSRKHAY